MKAILPNRMVSRRLFQCLLLRLWFSCSHSPAQSLAPAFAPREEIPRLVTFFAPLLLPKIIQDEYRLKDYICSETFAGFRRQYGDVYAVDALFDKAVRLSWNNIYEALLISFLATMEHHRFGVNLPVLGPLLWFPLTSEFQDDFQMRVNSLPARLYDDTPATPGGDRDKLQHFFGSAFLTYVLESPAAAERVGEFIEVGEDAVIVGGALDQRDLRADRQGQEFGSRLLDDEMVLPSGVFLPLQQGRQDTIPPDNTLKTAHDETENK